MERRRTLSLKQKLILLLFPLCILLLDQFTKKFVMNSMFLGESKKIIGNIVRFTYIRNPNSVFGLHIGGPLVSTILTGVAFIFVIYLFITGKHRLFLTGISFIIGGALGNLADRFFYMEVVDFVDIGIKEYRWPTFNVADSFVTIGIILVIIYYWVTEVRYANSTSNSV
ncbi:MAG: signal peptidase II [candidate division WOR-3 bacterium]|nr:signal peptidase II [candidate division WOR-3 bacterium]